MAEFHVVEHFISINGEGRRAGQLALFIRFAGCNLSCAYCDTAWANEGTVRYESYTAKELYRLIKESGVKNVTLTGGEPLLQNGMPDFLACLRQDNEIRVEIETNGSVPILPFLPKQAEMTRDMRLENEVQDNISFTVDYKTAVSKMEQHMCLSNYANLRKEDTVKFVVGSIADMETGCGIIEQYGLRKKGCGIYFSPCFGKIEPAEMVDFLVKRRMNDVNIQLQLHKYIWSPDMRGV